MIKIVCLTGTRADYPRVKSVLLKLKKNKKFKLKLVVTGTHLSKKYGYSVKEMLDQIEASMDVKLNPEIVARRAGDSPKLIASIKKIEKDLGWLPKATLKEMIDSAWAAEKGAK